MKLIILDNRTRIVFQVFASLFSDSRRCCCYFSPFRIHLMLRVVRSALLLAEGKQNTKNLLSCTSSLSAFITYHSMSSYESRRVWLSSSPVCLTELNNC